ncbi:hypothetical protein SLEP1_g55410 [Rubroshorea leprosula]|uniref:Uncharacterized protein n=1 Tax=Rubroshorea leprosula TaxID=152421 RepID=A0AAV5MGG3_9ROSI|nr:hypothetical protein SLEP1_g55410 [Rubroshorea leprosula]
MVHTRSIRAGNSSLPHGQGQPHNNLPPLIPSQIQPQLPPQVPTIFPPVDHAERGDENQPHASAHNSTSTTNHDVVTAQLAAMQQQFGVFQLVLAQLLARNNPGDPLINLLNPAQQPPAPQQNPQLIPPAPAISESQGQSHIAPAQQPIPDDRDGESLKNYMSRFNDAVLEVSSFDQAVGVAAVISGLKHDRFRDSLIKHAATTFSEVNDRSLKFITAEEYALAQNPPSSKNQNPEWRDDNPSRKRMRMAQNRGPMLTSPTRFGRTNSTPPQQPAEERAELIAFLRANNDVFAWTSADMPGIPNSVSQHKLSTNPLKKPVAQKRRLFGGERLQAIKEEVTKLLQAGFIRKVDYCEWVANPVFVKKANGKWRMCIDYTNLNNACPKDCYPMPSIDKLVEAASGNERLSLLDAYSGYHQVLMALEDEEKTAFYAGDEIYCYVMMPFGLKNAGATYQKMVTIVFHAQIGKNLEVYVDDIVVKSLKAEDHLANLDETFNNLRKNRMRLNPAKCIFGVESGKFLGFMVSRRGIEVNPEKIRAIAKMEPPKSVKDIQRLTGRVAALHRFISKSADKCLPFFKIMRSVAQKDESGKHKKFEWNQECQAAFEELKSYLSSPPLLTKAIDGELLYLYLGISDEAIKPNDWTLYVDGASSSKGSGAGALLIGPEGYRSQHALKFNFDATNNMAEYEALLLGLQLALELKIRTIQVYSDSQLVVNQINSICEVVDHVMVKYVALVAELKCKFQKFCLSKIPRAENEQADLLSKFASDSSLSSRSVFVEVLDEPSFMKPRMMEISTNPDAPSWTDSIISFLRDGIVPEDRQEAMKLRKKASRYTLADGVLYKRSFSLPLLRCLNPYEAEYALREVHEGVCGSHVGARTLAHKVLRQGYYWPNMYKDATHFVQKCPKCQFFAHLTHQPAEELTTLVAPWPFAQWGLDFLGPFVKGVGGVTHLVVGVDYFTKWVEARPLSSLTSKKVEDFVFSLIICRYGIPNQIVADNGTQFNCSSFRDFCSSYGIKLQFTSVYHPESNGMVESVNKCILEGIKPRLEQHKTKWADELNNVLWAYRTTSRTATCETPYHLAFGTEAVIPVEIGVSSFRVTHFDEGRNGQLLRENLDLLAEGLKLVLANSPQIGKALIPWPKCHILVPIFSKTLKEREFLESGMSIT